MWQRPDLINFIASHLSRIRANISAVVALGVPLDLSFSIICFWNIFMIDHCFGDFRAPSRKAARDACHKGVQAIEFVDLKLIGAREFFRLSDRADAFLRSLRGPPKLDQGLPMCSGDVRAANGIAAVGAVLAEAHTDKALRTGDRRLRMLTIKPDIGLVDVAGPSFPANNVRAFADRTARGVVLDGLFQLDLALICPGRGNAESLAACHVHGAVVFPVEREWKEKDWLKRLVPGAGNANALGDTIVDISSHGNNRNPRLTRSDVAGLGWYISKETAGVNTIYQSGSRGQQSEGNHTDWTCAGVLRQLEFWSHLSVFDISWSQGTRGNAMRTAWRRRMLELLDLCEMPKVTSVDSGRMHEGWARVWREIDNGFQPIDPDTVKARTLKQLRQIDDRGPR